MKESKRQGTGGIKNREKNEEWKQRRKQANKKQIVF
jgi:hypothetical protein